MTPKKVVLLENDFTIESGELTPTLKVKRRVVEKRYKDQIDACSSAFNRLTQGYGYDTQYRGFQDW